MFLVQSELSYLSGEEQSVRIGVIKRDEDGRRHVQRDRIQHAQILGLVHGHRSLALPREARDDEVLAVERPHDPGSLLGHDLAALEERGGGGAGVEEADLAIAADGGEEAAALGPLHAVDLVRVALGRERMGRLGFSNEDEVESCR